MSWQQLTFVDRAHWRKIVLGGLCLRMRLKKHG